MRRIEIDFVKDKILGRIWWKSPIKGAICPYDFSDEYELGTDIHEIVDELIDGMNESKKL